MPGKKLNDSQYDKYDGFFIYRDDKGNMIYSDYITGKTGYYLDSENFKTFSLYSMRMPASFSIFVLLFFAIKIRLAFALTISILFYIVTSAFFYKKFLPGLESIDDFKKEKESYLDNCARRYDNITIVLMIAGSIALCVLSIINSRGFNEPTHYYGNLLLAAVGVAYCLFMIAVMYKKIMNKKR